MPTGKQVRAKRFDKRRTSSESERGHGRPVVGLRGRNDLPPASVAAFDMICTCQSQRRLIGLRVALEAGVDKQTRLMRIGDYFLEDVVAAVGRMVDDFHPETGGVEVIGDGMEVAAFLVEESLAVGDQELEVANLRRIDSRKINFVEDPGRSGEP